MLREVCDLYDVEGHPKFKKWCDDYFFITHRNEPRGVGRIFYDYINSGNWEKNFYFSKNVGEAFLKIYPQIVNRHFNTPWSEKEAQQLLKKRGRYVEFNLIHDRRTKFGLQTVGNTEAILMSPPPLASWKIEE